MYTNESEYTPTDVNRLGRECSTEQEAVQQLQILEYLARETVEITLRKNPKAAFEHLKIPFPNEEFAVVLDQSLASYGAWRHLTKRLRGNSLTDLVALHLGLDPIRGFFRIADWLNIDTSPEARFFQGCDPGWHECRSGVEAKDFEKATKSYPYYTLNNAIGLRYPYTNEDGTLRWGVVKLFDKKERHLNFHLSSAIGVIDAMSVGMGGSGVSFKVHFPCSICMTLLLGRGMQCFAPWTRKQLLRYHWSIDGLLRVA
jgi:hypothetical protein